MKSYINMSRASATYLGGLGLLMVTSLVLSNIPGYGLSNYIELRYIRYAAAALFSLGGLCGIGALSKHFARVKEPWRVPQSQVSILYVAFVAFALLGIFISH